MFRRTVIKLASSLVVAACVAPTTVEKGGRGKTGAMQARATGNSDGGRSY